ncbi:FkbM family methyltransferase [Pelagibacteraceae bacterium]|nr:FkbM family methyltransferase [Pelagibacteraceae bacterium]
MYKFFNLLHKRLTSSKKFYSFGGIDILVDNIFKNQKKGYYVDVGCSHPIKNNNTYLLHKKGWTGINIDLDFKNIELFNYSRPNDTNINSAISDKESEEDFFFYHDKSPINTLSKEISTYQEAKVTKVKKIKTILLNSVLKNSPFSNLPIDFLSIDVEGLEYKILKSFDFIKYKPKVIVVEYLDTTLLKLEIKNSKIDNVINSNIYILLVSKGYSLVNWLHSDLVFVNNSIRD